MFPGSEGSGNAMAIVLALIKTAKLNNLDPQTRLTWVFAQITDHKITRLDGPSLGDRRRTRSTGQVHRTGTLKSTLGTAFLWSGARPAHPWLVPDTARPAKPPL